MAKKWIIGTALIGSISLLGGTAAAQFEEEPLELEEEPLEMEEQVGIEEQQEQPAIGGAGQAGEEEAIWRQMGQAFTVEGRLTEQDGNDLTISRPNLPPIQLEVRGRTQLNFPDRDVTYENLEQLPIGEDVRARFQIIGEEVVALSLEPAKGAQKKQKPHMGQHPGQKQQY